MARNYDLSVRLRAAVEGLSEVSKLISEIDELGGATEESADRSKSLSEELRRLEKADGAVQTFRNLKTEVSTTSQQLEEAQRETQRLGKELAQSSKPTKQLERDFERARKSVRSLKDQQEQQIRSLQEQRQELKSAGVDSRNLSEAQTEIRQATARTNQEIDELTTSLQQARDASRKEFNDPTDRLQRGAQSADRSLEGLGGSIRNTAAVAVGSVAAFFGIQEAIQGIAGIARIGGEFEIMRTRLEALTGSAREGEEAFQWIQEFTRNTPFQMQQVTDAFVKAKAFGLDPMDGTLQAIADQAAKTGGGIEALNGIVGALGQAFSKNKIQAEEMLQLIERGVPAWDLLADATGRTASELQEMTTAGELGRKEIKLLIDQIGKASEGAAADQMSTLQGLVSNLQDQFKRFIDELNQAGALEYFKDQIRAVSSSLKEMRENGELQAWAKSISNAIKGTGNTIKTIATLLYEYRDAIKATAQAWIFYKGVQASVALAGFANVIKTQAITAMSGFGAATGAASGKLGKMRAGLRAIPGPAKIAALAAVMLGFDKVLVKAGESLGNFLGKYSEAAQQLAEFEKRNKERAQRNIESLNEEIEKLEEYRAVRTVTAKQAVKMSEEEQAAREEQLKKSLELFQKEKIKAMELANLGYDVSASMEDVRESIDATEKSLAALGAASQKQSRAIENGISTAAQGMVDEFHKMIKAGKDASEATDKLFQGFDSSNTSDIKNLVQAIGQISKESEKAGKALDKELAERLDDMSGDELQRFAIALEGAFDRGSEAARQFAELSDRIADAALQNIGTSLQEIRTGISEMETAALDSFQAFAASGDRSIEEVRATIQALQDDISSPEAVTKLRGLLEKWASESGNSIDDVRKQLDQLALNVEGTAQQISAELTSAIKSAGNAEALAEVKKRIKSLWNEGKIGADLYAKALGKARDRQRELAQEAKKSGQQTADSMDQAAKAAERLGEASKQAAADAKASQQEAKSVGSFLAQFFNNTTERLLSMGTAVHDSFLAAMDMKQPKRELDGIRSRITQLGSEISDLQGTVLGFNVISGWLKEVSIESKNAERNFLKQKLAVGELLQEFEKGDYSADVLNSSVAELEERFNLLGEKDLGPLKSAISRIQGEVDSLNDSLSDTIASLRQELAGLRGNNAEVERLRYKQEQAELEKELQRARKLGDEEAISKAEKALQLQKEAYQVRRDQAEEKQRQEQEQEAERAAEREREQQRKEQRQREESEESFAREERQAKTSPSRTIVLQGPSGKSAEVAVGQQEEGDLIAVLEDLGYRSNAE